MYITKDKVFLHMVKSAGISVHSGLINSDNVINYNERHASIEHLPERYKDLPRYGVVRKPEDWYKSFYRFFVNVQGYMSFMLNDLQSDGYIYPIEFNEFVQRSINFKDTLIKFPNKARVFNNVLRSQANIHFVCGYFRGAINISKDNEFSDEPNLKQFDMSLYEWFYNRCGMNTSINIPMDRLQDVENLFGIYIGHENKTKSSSVDVSYNKDTLELVRKTHKKFYDEFDNYKGVE